MNLYRRLRRALRPLKRAYDAFRIWVREFPYRFSRPSFGSSGWLIKKEIVYGGHVSDVPRTAVSPLDPRSKADLEFGGMTGGDRMLHNNYAPVYATYLAPFIRSGSVRCVAEFGILTGTGLAIWCDLFPKARIFGFDIDLGHFHSNIDNLLQRGAFKSGEPSVFIYDQFVDGSPLLRQVIGTGSFDVVIDDGFHSEQSILTTWRSVRPYLSERFVYFIEDYPGLLEKCPNEFAGFQARSYGALTVVTHKDR
jgi:hypothetical protein